MAAIGGTIVQAVGSVAATAVLAATVAELSQSQRSTHWSFYVLTGAACVAAIVAVAAVVMANYPLTATSVLFCITNTIGALFIKRFSFYKDFDQTVDKLNKETSRVLEHTKALEKANEVLKQELEPLRKIEEALREQLEKRQALLAQQQQATGDLRTVVSDLNQGAASLLPTQQQAAQALSDELTRLIAERDILKVQVTSLTASATTVQQVDENLDIDRADLREQIQKLMTQINGLQAALDEMKTKGDQVGAEVKATTHQVGEAADQVTNELDTATNQDVATIRETGDQLLQATHTIQGASEAVDSLTELATFVQALSPRPPSRAQALGLRRDIFSPTPGNGLLSLGENRARSVSPTPEDRTRPLRSLATGLTSPLASPSLQRVFPFNSDLSTQGARKLEEVTAREKRGLVDLLFRSDAKSDSSSDAEDVDAEGSDGLSSISSSATDSSEVSVHRGLALVSISVSTTSH